ncbi:FAD-dependent oxidoreductase [Dactylosporangium sp. NPDC051541]|uniref:FAD-dependent oxidoreductase n=1 Tax=Dactylosporangium sp. NPDC051541 TaxID=3363977 RepID=UPI00379C23CB
MLNARMLNARTLNARMLNARRACSARKRDRRLRGGRGRLAVSLRVAVIGAGPAGATAAYCLAKAGVEVDVYEASGGVGGLARSVGLWGQTVGLGPQHFFSTDPRVNELWLEVIGGDYEMVEPVTRIHPPRAALSTARLGALIRQWQRAQATPPTFAHLRAALPTFAHPGVALSTSRLGARIRQWQRPRTALPAFAHLRAALPTFAHPGAALSTSRLGALIRQWQRPQATLPTFAHLRAALPTFAHPGAALSTSRLGALIRQWQRARTALPAFAHPRQGPGEVYSRMCEFVEKQGGRVHLNTPVARLVLDDGRVTGVQLNNDGVREHDHVVSSMPLAVLTGRLPDVPAEVAAAGAQLTLCNTVVVFLRTNAQSVFPDTWVNVRDPDLHTGRITNFDNWVPAAKHGEPETILALEYWCTSEHDFWRWEDEEYVRFAREELIDTGLVEAGEVLDGVALRVPKSIPVYRESQLQHQAVVEEHLKGLAGLEVIGPHGPFARNRQDFSILMGLLAAENIVEDAGHDLWADPATHAHPATSRITATGLAY